MISDRIVVIAFNPNTKKRYPQEIPFRPDKVYPELKGKVAIGEEQNITYTLFRHLMHDLGMDIDRFSTAKWNPLGGIIRPGQKVLIKPNLVRHLHLGGGNYQTVVTHPSLVRCVLDYVALALKGKGEMTVGDAPVQSADFSQIVRKTGLQKVCDDVTKTWHIPVRLLDFRLSSVRLDDKHRIINSDVLKGDPNGYVAVNLGKRSLLTPSDSQSGKFRVTNYDYQEMRKHHNEKKHEYLIPRTVIEADVVVNLPKLKTHRKVGMTAALKNIVGINGHKDWLPHHRCGSVEEGGDEYRYPSFSKRFLTRLDEKIDKDPYSKLNSLRRLAIRSAGWLTQYIASDSFEEGSWYGNDTLWRTVLDLNRLVVYADKEGMMSTSPQRQFLNIVDGIVAGEGEGPMEPDARLCGMLVGGSNPVAVDAVLATMIGFDYRKIPLIAKSFEIQDWPLLDFKPEEIKVLSQDYRWKSLKVGEPCTVLCFVPPSGWFGHIEFNTRKQK